MSLLRPGVIKQHKPNQTKPKNSWLFFHDVQIIELALLQQDPIHYKHTAYIVINQNVAESSRSWKLPAHCLEPFTPDC